MLLRYIKLSETFHGINLYKFDLDIKLLLSVVLLTEIIVQK